MLKEAEKGKGEEQDAEGEQEEEELEAIRATGLSKAVFGVIESFAGTRSMIYDL